jgi:Uma2 family endonuclease
MSAKERELAGSMTPEEFFAWQETQTDRYELVDGRPHKLTGAENLHDDIVVNLVAELREKVRGSQCRPFTGDGSVETRVGRIRRPDVGVDCGPRDPVAMTADLPKLIIEVLSPISRDFDAFNKLDEYTPRSISTNACATCFLGRIWPQKKAGHGHYSQFAR